MSEVKRYVLCHPRLKDIGIKGAEMIEMDGGEWVRSSDYERLKEQRDKAIEYAQQFLSDTSYDNDQKRSYSLFLTRLRPSKGNEELPSITEAVDKTIEDLKSGNTQIQKDGNLSEGGM